jgi:hypothetical protein
VCRKLIVILAVLLVYGCIPAPTIYYKPESTAGQRVRIGSTEIAPADGWEMKAGNATVRLKITPGIQSSPRSVWVSVSIPPGSRAVFATTDIRVISDGLEEVLTMKTLVYTEDKPRVSRAVSAKDLLVGGSISLAFGVEVPRDYSTSFELSGPLGDRCEVLLPDLSVDGKLHSFDPVRFSKKFGAGLFFING